MPLTLDNRLDLAAEGVVIIAKEAGQRVGITEPNMAAVEVLERALAQAWCDVAMWRGANDTDERFNETARLARERLTRYLKAARVLRRGHKPS